MPGKPLLIKAAAWGGVLALSLTVLMLYRRPDFLVMLADQLWACF